jgi:excisionase family DNA binding protein
MPSVDSHTPTPADPYGLAPILSVADVAAFLGLDPKTVYGAITRHELPARRIGKRLVVLRDALLSWLRAEERGLPSPRRSR